MTKNIELSIMQQVIDKKVFTVTFLVGLMSCSVRTAKARLKQWNAYTSYNCNAKYHTMPEVPRFDENGIWHYDGTFFSKHGNLTQTVIHLVCTSVRGLSLQEICTVLGIPAGPVATHIRSIKALQRERIGRRVVYFSNEDALYQTQSIQRTQQAETSVKQLSHDVNAVCILVDRIKNPDSPIEQCTDRLRASCPGISVETVRTLLQRYGLLKKTADTP
jgi:hypothetical protein